MADLAVSGRHPPSGRRGSALTLLIPDGYDTSGMQRRAGADRLWTGEDPGRRGVTGSCHRASMDADALRARIDRDLVRCGRSLIALRPEPPGRVGWTYSIGLSGRGLPELVTFGLPPDAA